MTGNEWRPSIATAISWLALVIALGGTAVAAAPTLVRIVGAGGNVAAKVDGLGNLKTVALPTAPRLTFRGHGQVSDAGYTQLTDATRATLALSSVTLSNLNFDAGASPFTVQLYYKTSTAADCSGGLVVAVATFVVPTRGTFDKIWPHGFVFKPPASGYWCLLAKSFNKGNPAPYVPPLMTHSGFVVSGAYADAQLAPTVEAED